VSDASTTQNQFVPGTTYQTLFHVENRPTPDGQPHSTLFRRVSPGYFRTMRIRELRGRTFTADDTLDRTAVAVISRQLADQLFPNEEAVGRVLRRTAADAPPMQIIGIVDDVRDVSLTEVPAPTIYLPWSQNNNHGVPVSLVIRTSLDPASLIPAVRAAVAAVDPSLPLRAAQPLEQFLGDSVAPERFRTTVLGIMGILGLALAALGIYGVTYRGVVERTHEFAVRMALGSARAGLLRLVLGDALRDIAVGAGAGVVAGLALTSALQRIIANAGSGDARTAAVAVAALVAAALVAAGIPALRILRVQPADALAER
jgi:putative ABC transport system permease protein